MTALFGDADAIHKWVNGATVATSRLVAQLRYWADYFDEGGLMSHVKSGPEDEPVAWMTDRPYVSIPKSYRSVTASKAVAEEWRRDGCEVVPLYAVAGGTPGTGTSA